MGGARQRGGERHALSPGQVLVHRGQHPRQAAHLHALCRRGRRLPQEMRRHRGQELRGLHTDRIATGVPVSRCLRLSEILDLARSQQRTIDRASMCAESFQSSTEGFDRNRRATGLDKARRDAEVSGVPHASCIARKLRVATSIVCWYSSFGLNSMTSVPASITGACPGGR